MFEFILRYEALIFVAMYIIYVIIMYFNPRLGDYFIDKVDSWKRSKTGSEDDAAKERDAEKQPLLGENPKLKSGSEKLGSLDPNDGGPLTSSAEGVGRSGEKERRAGAMVPPSNGVLSPPHSPQPSRRRSADTDTRDGYQNSGFVRSHSSLLPDGKGLFTFTDNEF